MEVKITMTPEQQAADDARAEAYQDAAKAARRQTARNLPPEEYKAALAALTRPPCRAALRAAGPHASTLSPDDYARGLRRLCGRSPI